MRAVSILLLSVLVATIVCLSTAQPVLAQCATVGGTGMATVTVNQCPPSEEVRDMANQQALSEAVDQAFSLCRFNSCGTELAVIKPTSGTSQCTVNGGGQDPLTVSVTVSVNCTSPTDPNNAQR